ncbi:MAG: DNA-binding protein WhiA [Clostridiales bacterium]|nr:DNA-binding protein WhiA [Clostridiales bacterium]
MSFASDARRELAAEAPGESCCARAELAAALLFSGGISFQGAGRYSLQILSPDAFAVRHYFLLVKRLFGLSCQIRTLRTTQLKGLTRYQLVIPQERSTDVLNQCDLLDREALFGIRATPSEDALNYACCRRAFLRGAFLLVGAVSNPEKSYHLEFAAPNAPLAEIVIRSLNYFEISAKTACRKAKFVVYLKGGEQIADALALLGAKNAMMALENVRVKKDVGNRINRQINCDERNLARQLENAEAQIKDIELIEREIGLDKLPRSLREIAQVRREHDDSPLSALGEFLDPPLGKSGVNSRLRRLRDIAERFRAGEEIDL